jgi:hypothetical protein
MMFQSGPYTRAFAEFADLRASVGAARFDARFMREFG